MKEYLIDFNASFPSVFEKMLFIAIYVMMPAIVISVCLSNL